MERRRLTMLIFRRLEKGKVRIAIPSESCRSLCSSPKKTGSEQSQTNFSHVKEASKYVTSSFISSFADSLAFYLVAFGSVGVGTYFGYRYIKSLFKPPEINLQENLDKISKRMSGQGQAIAETMNEMKEKVASNISEKISSSMDQVGDLGKNSMDRASDLGKNSLDMASDLKQKSIDGAKDLKEKVLIMTTSKGDVAQPKPEEKQKEEGTPVGKIEFLRSKMSQGKAQMMKMASRSKEEIQPTDSSTKQSESTD
jgi:hypothetical protein